MLNKKLFHKRLLQLTLPIALQSLMLSLVAAGDAFMLGRVAQDQMTAVALASQVQFVQNMIVTSITGAVQKIQVAQEPDKRRVKGGE